MVVELSIAGVLLYNLLKKKVTAEEKAAATDGAVTSGDVVIVPGDSGGAGSSGGASNTQSASSTAPASGTRSKRPGIGPQAPAPTPRAPKSPVDRFRDAAGRQRPAPVPAPKSNGGGFKAPEAPRPNDLPIYQRPREDVLREQQAAAERIRQQQAAADLQRNIENTSRGASKPAPRGMKEGGSNGDSNLPFVSTASGMRQSNTFVGSDTKLAPSVAPTAPKFTPPTSPSVGPRVPMITVRPDLDPRNRRR
jgi:hypothetical protein